jgi:hypothetical protein
MRNQDFKSFDARTIVFQSPAKTIFLNKSLIVRFAEHQCKKLMCIRGHSESVDSWREDRDRAAALSDRRMTGERRISFSTSLEITGHATILADPARTLASRRLRIPLAAASCGMKGEDSAQRVAFTFPQSYRHWRNSSEL